MVRSRSLGADLLKDTIVTVLHRSPPSLPVGYWRMGQSKAPGRPGVTQHQPTLQTCLIHYKESRASLKWLVFNYSNNKFYCGWSIAFEARVSASKTSITFCADSQCRNILFEIGVDRIIDVTKLSMDSIWNEFWSCKGRIEGCWYEGHSCFLFVWWKFSHDFLHRQMGIYQGMAYGAYFSERHFSPGYEWFPRIFIGISWHYVRALSVCFTAYKLVHCQNTITIAASVRENLPASIYLHTSRLPIFPLCRKSYRQNGWSTSFPYVPHKGKCAQGWPGYEIRAGSVRFGMHWLYLAAQELICDNGVGSVCVVGGRVWGLVCVGLGVGVDNAVGGGLWVSEWENQVLKFKVCPLSRDHSSSRVVDVNCWSKEEVTGSFPDKLLCVLS